MTTEYYQIWSIDMDLILSMKGLDDYIYNEKIKIISKDSTSYSSKCKKVNGTVGYYYSEGIDDKMIREDYKAKKLMKWGTMRRS
ncbi:hypothetical protein PIROE2DRAFT_10467 [Piromyces sp. E2]|nr:hypothetical protein PIROE2DRAFT_10467 [Piromyces sp. E2]|eukprot:OUM63058.1 hypothetical protein PIROE2DRAFT_10467 [Piromyces sp. E2]